MCLPHRRYTYRALPEFGGFVFENGHCAKEWLSFVVGRRLQPTALPQRPPRRKGAAATAGAAATVSVLGIPARAL